MTKHVNILPVLSLLLESRIFPLSLAVTLSTSVFLPPSLFLLIPMSSVSFHFLLLHSFSHSLHLFFLYLSFSFAPVSVSASAYSYVSHYPSISASSFILSSLPSLILPFFILPLLPVPPFHSNYKRDLKRKKEEGRRRNPDITNKACNK